MQEIILPTDTYSFTLNVPLDGIVYLFKFNWNDRLSYWSYNIALSDGTEVISGQRLITSANLLERFSFSELPSQLLLLYDTLELNEPPTFEGLGRRWRLMYGDPV